MKSSEFTGSTSEMRDSPWLASEDIVDLGDIVVEIERCYRCEGVQFDEGRTEDKFALAFKGKTRQLILNQTNRKILRDALGKDVSLWPGKKIALYVDKNVRGKEGKTICGIRIRRKLP